MLSQTEMSFTNPTTRIQPFQGEVLPWSRTLQNSPELCAVEGGDDVGSVLRVGCDPPGFPGFPLRVHQGAGQDVELLGVVKTPSDLHRSVLQLLQFHGAAWGLSCGWAAGNPRVCQRLLERVRDPRDNGKLVGKDQLCVGMASMDIEE